MKRLWILGTLAILVCAVGTAVQSAPTTLYTNDFNAASTPAALGWVHDPGTAEGDGYVGPGGRNGSGIFGIGGRWSHPLSGNPMADGTVTVSAYLDPAPFWDNPAGRGTARLSLTSADATTWVNDEAWSSYGPTLFFNSQTSEMWLRQPAGAGNVESNHRVVPGFQAVGNFKMVVNTSTGLADGYFNNEKMISGFDMKGSWTLDQFKTNIVTFNNIFWWDVVTIGAQNGQMDNLLVTTAPNATLIGIVTLEDYHGSKALVPVQIDVKQGTDVAASGLVTLDTSSHYTLSGIPEGTYDISFSACKCVPSIVKGVTLTGGASQTCSTTLKNGDLDGDGTVTTTDVSTALKNLDK